MKNKIDTKKSTKVEIGILISEPSLGLRVIIIEWTREDKGSARSTVSGILNKF